MTHGTDTLVAVGMSGGVDSSMAAYLLLQAGHRVLGLTMRLRDAPSAKASDAHVGRARAVARRLGIEHRVIALQDAFEACIVTPFVESYARGLTPSPCAVCNARVKFGLLLDHARKSGCTALATGHYVRRDRDSRGQLHLRRGRDPGKDQSYFLGRLTPEQLRQARFPLGDASKDTVRRTAAALGLVPREQGESQDLCFIPDGDYAAFLERRRPGLARTGPIVDTTGQRLGSHGGCHRYTIGQRRGLGLSGGPWYVVALEPQTNTVMVGRRGDQLADTIRLRDVSWLQPSGSDVLICSVQLRYNMTPIRARVELEQSGSARVCLESPASAVTPGQLAVFYADDDVLGSGWIVE